MLVVNNREYIDTVYIPFLIKAMRKWVKLNRKDLDPDSDIYDLMRNEILLTTKFINYDLKDDGSYSMRLDKYAICNMSYAKEHKLSLTPMEIEGGNLGNENQHLKFKKYIKRDES